MDILDYHVMNGHIRLSYVMNGHIRLSYVMNGHIRLSYVMNGHNGRCNLSKRPWNNS